MIFTRLLPRYTDNPDLSGSEGAYNQGVNTGQNAINSFDPTAKASSQQNNVGAGGLGGLLGGETAQYTSDYANAVKNNPNVTTLYNTANNMYNVPQLAATATQLNNRLTNAVPDAYKGAYGYDIDSTDINNGIAAKEAYLTPQANAANANYNTASGLASNFVNAGITQNQQNLLPIQAQGTLLQQQEGMQGEGWNQASANEFNALIAKMNAGVTLSQAELARANQLAQLEEDYQKQQTINAANIANTIQGQKYITVPAGSSLVNTLAQGFITPSNGKNGTY